MFLISDLDNTLIYSHQTAGTVVECMEGCPVTRMMPHAYAMLLRLLDSPEWQFVPCTMRSKEQTARINFLNSELGTLAICDNGFSIYRHGILDKQWDNHMHQVVDTYAVNGLCKQMLSVAQQRSLPIKQIKTNRDAFITIIFPNVQQANGHIAPLLNLVNSNTCRIIAQGRKIYVVPRGLDKGLAVARLRQEYPDELFVTAGDSPADAGFIALGDVRIVPRHAGIAVPGATVTPHTGPHAASDLLALALKSGM